MTDTAPEMPTTEAVETSTEPIYLVNIRSPRTVHQKPLEQGLNRLKVQPAEAHRGGPALLCQGPRLKVQMLSPPSLATQSRLTEGPDAKIG